MYIPLAKVTLTNWWLLRPKLSALEFEQLQLKSHFTQTKHGIAPYIHTGPRRKKLTRLALKKLDIKNISITTDINSTPQKIFSDLTLSAEKKAGFYNFSLGTISSEPSNTFSIKGSINAETFQTEAGLKIAYKFEKPDMDLLFALFGISSYYQAQGHITADAQLTGSIKSLARIQPNGNVELENWTINSKDGTIIDALSAEIDIKDGRIKTENLSADLCKGRITANLLGQNRKPEPYLLDGSLAIENVDLAELTNALQTQKKFTRGKASANYNFVITGANTSTLQGNGLITIDDADLAAIPLIKSLFNTIGMTKYNPLQMSDSLVLFSNSASAVKIEKARLTNRLAAIQAEPNGFVDIKSGQVDFYVVASPLKDIEELIGHVPFMKLFVELKNKLTRLHIKGNWSDPPTKLITKEPLSDIKEATVEFFSGTVKSSGQITRNTIDTVKSIFKKKTEN